MTERKLDFDYENFSATGWLYMPSKIFHVNARPFSQEKKEKEPS